MKRTSLITAVVLVLALMITAISAATPSAERPDSVRFVWNTTPDGTASACGRILNEDGTVDQYITEDMLTIFVGDVADVDGLDDTTVAEIKAAEEGQDGWLKVYRFDGDIEALWAEATKGIPMENAVPVAVFYAEWIGDPALIEGKRIEFDVAVEGIDSAEDLVAVLHLPTGEEAWKFEDSKVAGSVITIGCDTLSPFIIVGDSGEAPAQNPEGPTSPQTGVVDYAPASIACAVLFGAFAVVCALKAKKD
ncbi:MAG: hypothetical protein J5933_05580 [Clostridia bacterium]|nr:hypothetical protein [Clostridia bacterium]